jgi:SOS-response transcriptional repressor LexA
MVHARPGKESRSIRVAELVEMARFFKSDPPGLHIPAARERSPAEARRQPPRITLVPLLDTVTAGKLSEPMSQIPVDQVPLLAFADLGRGDFFALKVEGDSMDRISPDGSIIVVNRADRAPVDRAYYVFSYRGETTFKMWRADEPAHLAPYSTNPIHQPMFFKRKRDLEVIGRVKRTVLDL